MTKDASNAPVVSALTVKEFCKRYSLSRSTLYELIRKGEIRTARIGGRRLIPVVEAEALLARNLTEGIR